jgi:hypothetical protein
MHRNGKQQWDNGNGNVLNQRIDVVLSLVSRRLCSMLA